ncbi:hypothetical protein [Enterococcus xiangfangensis]|uniref:Uncharacterized protein n=1 Tax=Enterococcus xiangfangensis TaxID=1296537 RepID=A0ABU3FCR2_9ENTE|nr:hypothetical protein [Enterococcus xiangfangensis]MDT2760456.1 hypothetical protein [Enterococcus xiangfangensis]
MKKKKIVSALFLSSSFALLLNVNEVHGEVPIYNPMDPTEEVTPIEGTSTTTEPPKTSSSAEKTTETTETSEIQPKKAEKKQSEKKVDKTAAHKSQKKNERVWLDDLLADDQFVTLPTTGGGGTPVLETNVLAKVAAKLSGKVLMGSSSQKSIRFIL